MGAQRYLGSRRVHVAAVGLATALAVAGGWFPRHQVVDAVVAPPAAYLPVYNLTDLGVGPGDTESWANGINASGDVTGWTANGSNQQAFRYSSGTMTALGQVSTLLQDVGFAINASGEVAGEEADFADFNQLTALTWTGTGPSEVDPGRGVYSFAESLNDGGDVVGFTEPTSNTFDALYAHSGTVDDLNSLVTTNPTNLYLNEGTDIDTAGQIVGDGSVSGGPLRAFLFDGGTVTNLGVLGGKASDGTVATAINGSGHIVGYQYGTLNHAFYWDGSLHDLGTISGYPFSDASDINASDWIVGDVGKTANGPLHAMVEAPGGVMTDLNTRVALPRGWTLESATSINDAGQIVGGANDNGKLHGFLLTPSNVGRIAGASRYDTAAMISAQNYASPQATVYIATGQNFPDALAGAALAGKEHAPLLLVPTSGALPASVVSELQRLDPTNIVIFGGTGAVSDAMLGNIETATGVTPTRIFGASRYDTAAQIAATYSNPQATVYIATGQNFPDALAGAALAGSKGAPLLLVPTNGALPASVTSELTALDPTNIVIFGGTGAVSDAMLGNIETATGVTPTRIFGASRYDTAAQIAATYSNPQATVYIATGQNFPDALAGAALAGSKGAPLLLVPTNGALPASVTSELTALDPTNIVIFGGTGAVSTSVELQIAQY